MLLWVFLNLLDFWLQQRDNVRYVENVKSIASMAWTDITSGRRPSLHTYIIYAYIHMHKQLLKFFLHLTEHICRIFSNFSAQQLSLHKFLFHARLFALHFSYFAPSTQFSLLAADPCSSCSLRVKSAQPLASLVRSACSAANSTL